MTAWLTTTLRHNAKLTIFLTLAVGYFVGPLRLGGSSLGNATSQRAIS